MAGTEGNPYPHCHLRIYTVQHLYRGFSLLARLYCNRGCVRAVYSHRWLAILLERWQSSAPAIETLLYDHQMGFVGKMLQYQSDQIQYYSVPVRAFLTTAALNWLESDENFRPLLERRGFQYLS